MRLAGERRRPDTLGTVPVNLSFTHMMVIGIVALVVLGPERLPGVARTAGNLYREWKRISGSLQTEVREVISEFTEPFGDPIQEFRDSFGGAQSSRGAAAAAPAEPLTALPLLGDAAGGLMAPGPSFELEIDQLGPPPAPGTFVPYPGS